MSSLEERIEEAIVSRFFEPSWLVQPQYLIDPQSGAGRTESVMTQAPAPMTLVAQAIYDQAKHDIIEAVLRQIDIDNLVEKWAPLIAKDVVAKLQATPDRWSPHPGPTERKKMMDKVYEAVAEEFGRQAVDHIRKTGGLMAVLEAGQT